MVAVGAYSRGEGLLTIFSSRVGAYPRGAFRGGGGGGGGLVVRGYTE